ncbi:hypothetical protein [Siphonobacter sp. SORGH_AS_1065]|uniref:hypothetical protein n=1 Tax=Siphonobacter sp. SORGH_AS_1065 TaxID=3041795 RepID=UPI0027856405|nr:hypothetical protein [Siphonobacter sp. SORGH_AS_1065]MDQ1085643.1 hypothetical protein [Siphonobacter sp. SORGH_AS_1065]
MLKTLTLEVPKHIKKFYENGEYGPANAKEHIQVSRWSELGKLLHLVSRTIPVTQKVRVIEGSKITFAYNLREKAYEIPYDKIPDLTRQLEEIFRRSLITYVGACQMKTGADSYAEFIREFLDFYDIIPDVDCDWEVLRKIYRDHLERIEKSNSLRRTKPEDRPMIRKNSEKSSAQKVRKNA